MPSFTDKNTYPSKRVDGERILASYLDCPIVGPLELQALVYQIVYCFSFQIATTIEKNLIHDLMKSLELGGSFEAKNIVNFGLFGILNARMYQSCHLPPSPLIGNR